MVYWERAFHNVYLVGYEIPNEIEDTNYQYNAQSK